MVLDRGCIHIDCCFFFFKQKTAYEMRISDWSSDVCSSDLIGAGDAFAAGVLHAHLAGGDARALAEAGLALTALKHSLPGDASRFGQADIDAFHGGGLDVRR